MKELRSRVAHVKWEYNFWVGIWTEDCVWFWNSYSCSRDSSSTPQWIYARLPSCLQDSNRSQIRRTLLFEALGNSNQEPFLRCSIHLRLLAILSLSVSGGIPPTDHATSSPFQLLLLSFSLYFETIYNYLHSLANYLMTSKDFRRME